MNVYVELRKATTKSEFTKIVNVFCEVLRTELASMGFKFEEHPDKGILGGQKPKNEECQVIGVYCDLNALRLQKKDRQYGKWLSEKNFSDLINFRNQLPND